MPSNLGHKSTQWVHSGQQSLKSASRIRTVTFLWFIFNVWFSLAWTETRSNTNTVWRCDMFHLSSSCFSQPRLLLKELSVELSHDLPMNLCLFQTSVQRNSSEMIFCQTHKFCNRLVSDHVISWWTRRRQILTCEGKITERSELLVWGHCRAAAEMVLRVDKGAVKVNRKRCLHSSKGGGGERQEACLTDLHHLWWIIFDCMVWGSPSASEHWNNHGAPRQQLSALTGLLSLITFTVYWIHVHLSQVMVLGNEGASNNKCQLSQAKPNQYWSLVPVKDVDQQRPEVSRWFSSTCRR